jgi:hypothetical protein
MKKSFSTVASYPPTWVAVIVVSVAVVILIGFFDPPLLVALFMILLGVALLLAWPLTMSTTGTLERLEFSKYDTSEQDREAREALAAELAELGSEQGVDQLQMLGTKLEGLTEVLRHRLDAGEMTYSRYLGTARSVYESGVDNLREVVVALRSVSNINEGYISHRLGELRQDGDQEKVDEEIVALESRQGLRDRQVLRVEKLLTQNETAMTALDATATALADAPIGREHASADADAAVAELVELAQRAGRYASS